MHNNLSNPAIDLLMPIVLSLLAAAMLYPLDGRTDVRLEGEPIQGGLIIGRTEPGNRVFLDDEPVKSSPDGIFLLGFGREAASAAELKVLGPKGETQIQPLRIKQRQYDIQRIDGLPEEQVTPPPEVLQRIMNDNRLVAAARNKNDDRTDFLVPFRWPSVGPVSGVYGSQRVLNGEPRRPHYGVDVAAEVGAEVVAPAPGIVTLAHPDMYFSGGTLIIDHGHGLSSTFLHLSKIEVRAGQRVEQGQLVARVGATGRVTGPHLDWRMNLRGVRLDPQLIVVGSPTGN